MRHLFRIILDKDFPDLLLNIFITAVALITRRGILRKEGNFYGCAKIQEIDGITSKNCSQGFPLGSISDQDLQTQFSCDGIKNLELKGQRKFSNITIFAEFLCRQ